MPRPKPKKKTAEKRAQSPEADDFISVARRLGGDESKERFEVVKGVKYIIPFAEGEFEHVWRHGRIVNRNRPRTKSPDFPPGPSRRFLPCSAVSCRMRG